MKSFQLSILAVIMFAFLSLLHSSCKKEINGEPNAGDTQVSLLRNTDPGFANNNMVIYWNEKASAILSAVNPPPNQARQFAMVQIAVHDALNTIKPKYKSFALVNAREKDASPDAAVASAAYWALKSLVPSTALPLDSWLAESLATIAEGENKELGKNLGRSAAMAILANRSNDGFAHANAVVAMPDATLPGGYRSTLPYSNTALGLPKVKAIPNWGTLRPFSVTSNSQFRPGAPDHTNSSAYVQDFNEVKMKGAREMHTRTAEETEIGFFWVERSPTAWNRFTRNVLADKKMDAWKTARLFALLNTAMSDAVTGTFEAKYHYFYWRPETAIRIADDGNSLTVADPAWLPSSLEIPAANPLMNAYTPPMPDYPSAHSALGGSAAEVLKLFFGTDETNVTQTSATLPGVTRHYSSFSKAARDNAHCRAFMWVIILGKPALQARSRENKLATSSSCIHSGRTMSNHQNKTMKNYAITAYVLLLAFAIYCSGCEKADTPPPLAGRAPRNTPAPPTNQLFRIGAGYDHIVMIPADYFMLGAWASLPNGTDYRSLKWQWRFLAGPFTPSIAHPDSSYTKVTNIQEGKYEFEILGTLSPDYESKDTIVVTILRLAPILSNEVIIKRNRWFCDWGLCEITVQNVFSHIGSRRAFQVYIKREAYASWLSVPSYWQTIDPWNTPANQFVYFLDDQNLTISGVGFDFTDSLQIRLVN